MGILSWLFSKPSRYRKVVDHSRDDRKKLQEISIKNLKVGDYVTYEHIDYFIRQKLTYSAGGYHWLSYHFSDIDDNKVIWLDVEDDEELLITLSSPIQTETITEEIIQGKRPLTYDNKQFLFSEHGYANVTIEKADGESGQAKIEYWDYLTHDEKYTLTAEKWGTNDLEISYGRAVSEYEFEIYPT